MADHPPSAVGVALITTSAIFGVGSLITTCLRITVRCSRRVFGWDDVFMIAALLATIVRLSINVHAVTAGYGQHQDLLDEDQYIYTNFLSWLGQIFLFLSLCLLKTSIGLLIMRIKNTRKSKIFQWTIIAGLILTNVEVLIILLAECTPMKAYWEPDSGKCWPNKYRIYSIYVQVGYSILTDVIYTAMPAVIVWKLKMKTSKKLSICGLMSMGLVATVCAALRARSLGLKTDDLSWNYAIAAMWGNIELCLGIIAANMVLMQSYIAFFRGKLETYSNRTATSGRLPHDYSLSRMGWRKQLDHTARENRTERASEGDVDADSQKHLTRFGVAEQVSVEDHAKI